MRYPKAVAAAIAAGTLVVGVGIGAGVSGGHTTTTVTHTVAGPTRTVIRDVPGPTKTITKTVTVPAPQPTEGATIATFHGTGNEVTHEFNVPADGNYIVSWTFSDNGDGFGNGGNFIVNPTGSDDDATGLANSIDVSGHGSGEVQDAGSTDSLTVQAEDSGQWTLVVTAA